MLGGGCRSSVVSQHTRPDGWCHPRNVGSAKKFWVFAHKRMKSGGWWHLFFLQLLKTLSVLRVLILQLLPRRLQVLLNPIHRVDDKRRAVPCHATSTARTRRSNNRRTIARVDCPCAPHSTSPSSVPCCPKPRGSSGVCVSHARGGPRRCASPFAQRYRCLLLLRRHRLHSAAPLPACI